MQDPQQDRIGLCVELQSLAPRELIDALSIRIYEPPLYGARKLIFETATPLRALMLVLDFDTEVSMNGMLGFLENSTGLFLAETIDTFDRIGASETVEILRSIERTLQKHGVTPSRLRADFEGASEYQVTTFSERHGDFGSMPAEVEQDAKRLYLYSKEGEQVWYLLEAFVEKHQHAVIAEIARVTDA